MAGMFRLHKISSDIHLVRHRLISCGAKLSSPRFSTGHLTLLLRMAHMPTAHGSMGTYFPSDATAQVPYQNQHIEKKIMASWGYRVIKNASPVY